MLVGIFIAFGLSCFECLGIIGRELEERKIVRAVIILSTATAKICSKVLYNLSKSKVTYPPVCI